MSVNVIERLCICSGMENLFICICITEFCQTLRSFIVPVNTQLELWHFWFLSEPIYISHLDTLLQISCTSWESWVESWAWARTLQNTSSHFIMLARVRWFCRVCPPPPHSADPSFMMIAHIDQSAAKLRTDKISWNHPDTKSITMSEIKTVCCKYI